MRRGRERRKRESEKGAVREGKDSAEPREKHADAGGGGNQVRPKLRQPGGRRTRERTVKMELQLGQ